MTSLSLDDGTSGGLVACGAWSWQVRGLAGPSPAVWVERALEQAAGAGVLDLRDTAPLPGGSPVMAGEHVLPVPVHLGDLGATRALGARLAAALRPGDLVLLDGPLGAGKTSLAQGLGEALGVRGRVTSPTFVLAREHRGALPLLHVDAYRLLGAGPAALDDLELEAALEVGVVVVEWGAGLVEHLSPARLAVELGRTGEGRTARVRVAGARWAVLPVADVTV